MRDKLWIDREIFIVKHAYFHKWYVLLIFTLSILLYNQSFLSFLFNFASSASFWALKNKWLPIFLYNTADSKSS